MSGRFVGKVVLVAGGTGGLGRAVSLAFLDEGANVVTTYQRQGEFDALQQSIANKSLLSGQSVDVTDQAATQGLIDGIVSEHGKLDALVNCVGGYAGGPKLWESDPKVFELMLALNVRSGYMLARAAVPAMLKQGGGAIVNIASKAAVDHAAAAAAYVASKAAAVAMIDSLAGDLHGTAVRANSVLPSIIDTEANRKAMPKANFAHWPKPEEIAQVILFLCSDDAKLISGASIPVYGNS